MKRASTLNQTSQEIVGRFVNEIRSGGIPHHGRRIETHYRRYEHGLFATRRLKEAIVLERQARSNRNELLLIATLAERDPALANGLPTVNMGLIEEAGGTTMYQIAIERGGSKHSSGHRLHLRSYDEDKQQFVWLDRFDEPRLPPLDTRGFSLRHFDHPSNSHLRMYNDLAFATIHAAHNDDLNPELALSLEQI